MRRILPIVGLAVLTATQTARAAGPSFDCQKVKAPLAQIICADPELSALDVRFVDAYHKLLGQLTGQTASQLKQEDINFIHAVETKCGISTAGPSNDTPQVRACVKDAYEKQREAWESRLSGTLTASVPNSPKRPIRSASSTSPLTEQPNLDIKLSTIMGIIPTLSRLGEDAETHGIFLTAKFQGQCTDRLYIVIPTESLLYNEQMVLRLIKEGLYSRQTMCGEGQSYGFIIPPSWNEGQDQPLASWQATIWEHSNEGWRWGVDHRSLRNYAAERHNAELRIQAAHQAAQARTAEHERFSKEFGVQQWVSRAELIANPFVFKDQVVAVRANFIKMTDANEALFGENTCADKLCGDTITLLKVPTTAFKGNETLVLAIKANGTREIKGSTIPNLEYVGSYICKQNRCSDILN